MLKASNDWVDWLTDWLNWNKFEKNLCIVFSWFDFNNGENWRLIFSEEIDIIKKDDCQK